MKQRLNEIKSKAIRTKEKLSHDNPEQRKHITKLDMIIRGTTYVKWMLVLSLAFFMIVLVGSAALFYPDIKFILAIFIFSVIGGTVCWLAVVIQTKLYDRTINKTQQLLDAGQ